MQQMKEFRKSLHFLSRLKLNKSLIQFSYSAQTIHHGLSLACKVLWEVYRQWRNTINKLSCPLRYLYVIITHYQFYNK